MITKSPSSPRVAALNKVAPTLSRSLALTTLVGASLLAAHPAKAAMITLSTTAPTVGGFVIGSLTSAGALVNNVSSGANAAIRVGNVYPAQGQTFKVPTPISGKSSFLVKSFTMKRFGNLGGSIPQNTTFTGRVVELTGGNLTTLGSQSVLFNTPVTPRNVTLNDYVTFNFDTPIIITTSATNVYGFDFGSNNGFFNLAGTKTNPYANGTAYSSGANGVGTSAFTADTGDRLFAVTLAPVPEPGTVAMLLMTPGMLFGLQLIRRRRSI